MAATDPGHRNPSTAPGLVSVVVAVRNEAAFIRETVASLLAQEQVLELLLIDGMSDDGTREILVNAAKSNPRLRVIDNPRRTAPYAFNLGILAARGEYVAIFGAHAKYAPGYVATCIAELLKSGAAGCSGVLLTQPASDSAVARLVSAALSSRFGSSGNSVRTAREGFVDTIPFPLFRKDVLVEVGLYDVALTRNQDNDMNQRLRAAGHKLYLTAKTSAVYYPKATLSGLARHAYNAGLWNVMTARYKRGSMSLRHFVPLIFVIAVTLTATLAVLPITGHGSPWWMMPFAIVAGAYGICAILFSLQEVARQRSSLMLALPIIFFLFHCSYGLGSLMGLLRGAKISTESQQKGLR